MTKHTPKIAISMGDINGIGPEVALKLIDSSSLDFEPIFIGSQKAIDFYLRTFDNTLDLNTSQLHLIDSHLEVKPGTISGESGELAMKCVERGIDLCMSGDADAFVTAPISKEAIHLADFDFPGHTEFLAHKTGTERVLMIMISEDLRVCVFTKHIPVSQISAKIVAKDIAKDLKLLSSTLQSDFGIASPRIAVFGLNPHAGEGGDIGMEEIDQIIPAIESLKNEAGSFEGPFPADGFFGTGQQSEFDGIMAMYHDQGLVPFKSLSFNKGVNYTGGLPIIRCSPDHGTAFDIAGKGIAKHGSMVAATSLAIEVVKRKWGDAV